MKTQDPFAPFFATFPESTRNILEKVRKCIRQCAPDAKECIKYGIPTFELHGNLVHFSAYEKHIGFYPGPSGIAAFADEISKYKSAKGSVQFPLSEEIPIDLIREITLFRVKENKAKIRVKS